MSSKTSRTLTHVAGSLAVNLKGNRLRVYIRLMQGSFAMSRQRKNNFSWERPVITISVLVTAAAMTSCKHDHGDVHQRSEDSHAAHSDQTTEPVKLALNHGRKWKMDDHTRSSFAEMASSFSYSDRTPLEEEDLKRAGVQLQTQIKDLIQGCTMSGEAHDQLHVYLSGYMPVVKALAQSGGVEHAQAVRHYLDTYRDYFE